jgi:hypothetical protein
MRSTERIGPDQEEGRMPVFMGFAFVGVEL